MADVQPLLALRYDLDRVGELSDVISPPYDVIDPDQRAALLDRSDFNVVAIDLPVGADAYADAARILDRWLDDGVLVRDERPALWAIRQDYTGPDGRRLTRHGVFAVPRCVWAVSDRAVELAVASLGRPRLCP